MNRPIKFRAWLKNHNVMTEVSSVNKKSVLVHKSIKRNYVQKLEDVELMQFTGLLDKNWEEIYEGDIVRLHCSSNKENIITATIEWYEYKFFPHIHDKEICVKWWTEAWKMVKMYTVHLWWGCHAYLTTPRYLEVIWNIYENPDLLSK